MVNKSTIGAILLVILGFSLIIILPIHLISTELSSYNGFDESCSFIYNPSSPTPADSLYINVDEGNIEIRYINPPVDYLVLIEVNIVMVGSKLGGKSYTDYLNFSWYNSSSPTNFRMEIISNDWFNPFLWLTKEVDITVYLRKDIVFDIMTNLTKGDFELTVPWAASIGNLVTNVSNGNILYDFEYCLIQGNISGNINEGDLMFKSYDVEYIQKSSWDISVGKGNVNLEIYQDRDTGANITSLVKVNEGRVFILYDDYSADIGALLEIPYGGEFMDKSGFPVCISGIPILECTLVDGFVYSHIEPTTYEGIVYFISHDLLTNIVKHYYSIRFEILEGYFNMELTSIPSLFE